jgi:hypothetical protein
VGTKTGEMRESLMDCIERVKANKMDASQATAIAKLAAQVSLSMQVEANIRLEGLKGEQLPLGELPIGEQPNQIEAESRRPMLAGSSVFVHRIKDETPA